MLELKKLTKKFQVIPVVNDVSFSVKPGEVVGYLGPNGAGKSTTFKILTGLLEPTSGDIYFNGRNIKEDIFSYKEKIGYIPEHSDIYPHLTAQDYLLLVGRLRDIPEKKLNTKIIELMRLFNLSLDIDKELSSYSKGMIQKILISAALLHNPEILILDEPLSGLDTTTAVVIKEVLNLLAVKRKIILYSSHILEVVEKICSRVIIIHKGKILVDDKVKNLRNLMELPSLSDIFNELVVEKDTCTLAKDIVDVIEY